MRKVTFGAANSLDNYIARKDGAVDWLLWNDEVREIMGDYWKTIDTILMGRKTYEPALAHGGGKSLYKGMKTYVFSHTLKESPDKSVTIINEDAARFVSRLKEEEGKGICLMGGGQLAKSLFEANLIDEVGVNIHPVLLGSGIPMFLPMQQQLDLERSQCRPLKNGCVYIIYRVRH